MNEMMIFFQSYGWQLALIAFLGIVILGVLKYANAFSKVEKEKRKPIYFAISMGFSLIATIVYLLIIKQFDFSYVIGVTIAIYGLNQTMYAIYETTKLRDLLCKIFTYVSKKIVEKSKE
ncbi:hypothetical protein ACQQ4G_003150 [Listeria monocytogenes]